MGFFDDDDVMEVTTSDCGKCKRCLYCVTPYQTFTAPKDYNGIAILTNEPNADEDMYGTLGSADYWAFIKTQLDAVGVDYNKCMKVSALSCYSPNESTVHQYGYCKYRVEDAIKENRTKLIIALGKDVMKTTIADTFSRGVSFDSIRGFTIPSKQFDCWMVHVEHPKELFSTENFSKKILDRYPTMKERMEALISHSSYRIHCTIMQKEIRNAVLKCDSPLPEDPAQKINVTPLYKEEEIVMWLKELYMRIKANPDTIVSADLETSGLKCYNDNQFIYSIGLYYDKNIGAVAFKVDNTRVQNALRNVFSLNPKIVGANWKFDRNWLLKKLGIRADNLYADVCLLAHLLDNRDGVTSLKFNVYTRLGISYEDTVHKYLRAQGSNGINTINEAPVHDVLYYNALDVLYSMEVVEQQLEEYSKQTNKNKEKAYWLIHKGSIALAKIEYNGVKIDMNKVRASQEICQTKLDEVMNAISTNDLWKIWTDKYVDKASLLSVPQTLDILSNYANLSEAVIQTMENADRETLSRLVADVPFISYILTYRKYNKMLNTYLKSYVDEINDDGRIRCFYGLNNIATFRSSATTPNLQNQASRDDEQVEMLKACFVPNDGCSWVECDYTALESFGQGNIANDQYVFDCVIGGRDMHVDNMKSAFMMDDDYVDMFKKECPHDFKMLRSISKTVSFAGLYGASFGKIATSLLKAIHQYPIQMLNNKTLVEYLCYKFDCSKSQLTKRFTEHCESVLEDFWENRLKASYEWRESTYEQYLRSGEVHYITGHVYRGLASKNAVLNSPVQGSSFQCLLYSLIRITDELEARNMKTKVMLQVHDAIDASSPDDEREEYCKLLKHIMTVETKEFFSDFLSVPLQVAFEVSDKNWAEKEELHI